MMKAMVDLNISGTLSPVKQSPTESKEAQRANESARSTAPQPSRRVIPTPDEVEATPAETLFRYCSHNNITETNESYETVMMAVVMAVVRYVMQQGEEESARVDMEATQPDRSQTSHSSMIVLRDSFSREQRSLFHSVQ